MFVYGSGAGNLRFRATSGNNSYLGFEGGSSAAPQSYGISGGIGVFPFVTSINNGQTNWITPIPIAVGGTLTATNGFASYAPHTPVAVTVGASPFSYTNNTTTAQEVHVGGGTITTISKMGVTIPDNIVNTLQPTNYIVITYTLAPTMTTNAW
jgi:hypothetical protein